MGGRGNFAVSPAYSSPMLIYASRIFYEFMSIAIFMDFRWPNPLVNQLTQSKCYLLIICQILNKLGLGFQVGGIL